MKGAVDTYLGEDHHFFFFINLNLYTEGDMMEIKYSEEKNQSQISGQLQITLMPP